ncbi:MAG: hypothetical protein JNK85_16130 [Verrucomicrobiales bacterium]|nr:hypothetical protein [Verrucomicrobiales bacterium]
MTLKRVMDSDTPNPCIGHQPKPHRRGRRKWFGIGSTCFLIALVAFSWPRSADLRQFDPYTAAQIEGKLWRSYYQKDRLGLLGGLYRFGRDVYGFSPSSAAGMAWHAARAATGFQSSKNRSEARRALPNLIHYFNELQRGSPARFNASAVAEIELEWWQQRREGKHWREYAPLVAEVTARVYGVANEKVLPFASVRCEMMARRDAGKLRGLTQSDWSEIEAGLVNAWCALHESVNRGVRLEPLSTVTKP